MGIRLQSLAIVSALVCAVLVAPAGAQSIPPAPTTGAAGELRTIADPNGRFTIEVPGDWRVISLDAAIKQLASGALGDLAPGTIMLSGLVGTAPADPATVGATVFITAVRLPSGRSPAELVARLRDSGWNETPATAARGVRVIKAAPMILAGREAFYAYTTVARPSMPDLYQVLVFFPGTDALVLIGGMTVNEPGRVRTDMPLIVRIINTFQPTR
jgi:hypothetical protein